MSVDTGRLSNGVRRWLLAVLLAAIFLDAMDYTIANTAMPEIVRHLGGVRLFNLVLAVYTLSTSLFLPLFGRLCDRVGRKPMFLLGLTTFLVGSILSGLSANMVSLIVFRAIQGIGAGALVPVTLTIVGDIYQGQARGRIQGVVSAVWTSAALLGPLAGGILVETVGWRYIFFLNIPISIPALFLFIRFYPTKRILQTSSSFDLPGFFLFTAPTLAMLLGFISLGYPETIPTEMSWILIALSAFAFFFTVRHGLDRREAFFPSFLFRQRMVWVSNFTTFFATLFIAGVEIYTPLWIQGVWRETPVVSGLCLVPVSVCWTLGAIWSSRLLAGRSMRVPVYLGVGLVFLSATGMLLLQVDSPLILLVMWLSVGGFGMGLCTTIFTVVIQSVVGDELRGTATSSNTFMVSVGQTFGVGLCAWMWSSTLARQSARVHGVSLETVRRFLSVASEAPAQSVIKSVVYAVSSALHHVYIVTFVAAALAVLCALFIPSRQLFSHDQSENHG
ncbi:MAG: MFS transporter [Alicyclobacillaceae bacterium]|nr:MFS transporter [Alicyclobacillaceae bacterium]